MTFKLSVISEIERSDITIKEVTLKYGIQGHDTVRRWLKKYGAFD